MQLAPCCIRSLCVFLLVAALGPAPASAWRLRVDRSLRAGASTQNVTAFSRPKQAIQWGGYDSTGDWEGGIKTCHGVAQVNSLSDRSLRCPEECPLWAEVKRSRIHCDFECVENEISACAAANPDTPVRDLEMGICRSCNINGCEVCNTDGTDTCSKCSPGHSLASDGTCRNTYGIVWGIAFSVVGVLVFLLIAWVVDLACRPVTEQGEALVRFGLALRSRAKLHCLTETEGTPGSSHGPPKGPHRLLWPITTNLCHARAAGAGLMLQFNFAVGIIVWGLSIAVAWAVMAVVIDYDLFLVGTYPLSTPRENCILVAWGWETQHRLMHAKVGFVLGVYVLSTILAILHSIRQLRMFQTVDVEDTTHKDFAAECFCLPVLDGTVKVEDELKECIARAVDEKVVGVSVCWDYYVHEEELMQLIEYELLQREDFPDFSLPKKDEPTPRFSTESQMASSTTTLLEAGKTNIGFMRRIFNMMEQAFLSPTAQKIITRGRKHTQRSRRAPKCAVHASNLTPRKTTPRKTTPRTMPPRNAPVELDDSTPRGAPVELDIEDVLKGLKTGGRAFVVFDTEAARDRAIISSNRVHGAISYRGSSLQLTQTICEPSTVTWKNCAELPPGTRARRIGVGIAMIFVALMCWCVVFYLPWAYYVMSWNYANGQEPGFACQMSFSMIVVMGNALMYFICSEVADRVGFRNVDQREVCYVLLYTSACVFNVLLDLAISYKLAYRMMTGVGMTTYGGIPLSEVDTFVARFEAYSMQHELAEQLWMYSFPSTFLIPFLIEPIVTVYVPYKIMALIVRVHPEFSEQQVEGYLGSTPMDMSRYGDIMLNVILAVLMFFFPGGMTIRMFSALALSHCYIYLYDQWRVLRSIPACEFANMNVDWWTQWMLSIPCAIMLSVCVFKSNCEDAVKGIHCVEGSELVMKCLTSFFLHILVHTLVLVYVVPLFGIEEKPASTVPFKDCGRRIACSWFSSNPIHCLRSAFIYRHDPPCDFCLVGKEHLLRVNEEIGLHFEDIAAEPEDFNKNEAHELARNITRKISDGLSGLMSRAGSIKPEVSSGSSR